MGVVLLSFVANWLAMLDVVVVVGLPQCSASQPVFTWPGERTAVLAHGIRILGQDCLKITEILSIYI